MTGKRNELESGMPTARRQFLGNTARAGLAVLAAPALAANWIPEAHGAEYQRSYGSGGYGLELDGVFVGPLWTVSGGNVVGEVIAGISPAQTPFNASGSARAGSNRSRSRPPCRWPGPSTSGSSQASTRV
jgi:hypothetical protein